jgi:membrane associated rhomboid family serine protease
MPTPKPLDGSFSIMGGRVPRVVLFLIVATLAGTIFTVNVTTVLVLVPELVLRGQVWRLVTWPLVQTDPLALIFACLLLWVMGPDLVSAWRPGGYLLRYVAIAGGTGAVMCLLALALPPLRPVAYVIGAWSIVNAFLIAWALMFPHRQVYQFFVLPTSGRNLVYFTVGLTALFALLHGPFWVLFLPSFVAMGLMGAYLHFPPWSRLMAQLRRSPSGPKRARHLRAVDAAREDKPRWLH